MSYDFPTFRGHSGGRLRHTEIENGHMNDEVAEVISGLRAGETVVTHPADTLEAGSLVEERE